MYQKCFDGPLSSSVSYSVKLPLNVEGVHCYKVRRIALTLLPTLKFILMTLKDVQGEMSSSSVLRIAKLPLNFKAHTMLQSLLYCVVNILYTYKVYISDVEGFTGRDVPSKHVC